ncbi:MAG: hypothetical protein LIO50_08590 [Phascolarctobacterium sp.]|uniref:hypothetical protein n=1 Tax=Phascolarctobacterium sp. TaxID=2049039 RepID=UPI0025CC5801|nr:hypothetical protein [Phascolarctobacterium sp.]MCC8159258.1 hypothetical protein [Phascolarctobacterium sp.]
MAMYVYKDEARTEKLLAKNAQKADKNTRFYCPNSNCNAYMYICNVDGISMAYFRARRSYGHIDGCIHSSSNGFNPNNYQEDMFQFENALSKLMNPSKSQIKKETPGENGTGESESKPLHTIRQIYSMCKSYDCTDDYNGKEIGQMLIDDRSIYMYPKGVFGWRIIEGKIKKPLFYDNDKREITLVAPIKNVKYECVLNFDDDALFKDVRNNIYANRNKVIVIASQWSSSGIYNVFCAPIKSKKQVAILNTEVG